MAKPKNKRRTSLQDRTNSVLNRIIRLRNTSTSMFKDLYATKPDAIIETMKASGMGPKRMALLKAEAEYLNQRIES